MEHKHGQFTRISRTAHRCGLCGQIQYKLKWHKAKGRR